MTKKPTIGDCAGGHRIENREKNRDVAIVPRKTLALFLNLNFLILIFLIITADNFRPYLTSFQSNDNTDYINAVFVDVSLKKKRDNWIKFKSLGIYS